MSTVQLDPPAMPVDLPADAGEVESRAERAQRGLASALAQLRTRSAVPMLAEGRIAWAGGLLVAAGVVLVLLGWYGAANTSRLYLQIPYLISGGLLGVALAAAGGCVYLASWLTRLVHEERARADEAVAVARQSAETLARIEALLAGGAASGAPATASATGFVATPSGKLAHRPSCPSVAGRTDVRPVDPEQDGLSRCRMCNDSGVSDGTRYPRPLHATPPE